MKLLQKLLSIQEHIDRFHKNKETNTYKYVDGQSVLNEIRPKMNELKLILKQEILSIENTRQDYVTARGNTKYEVLSKVMMKFTWIDTESGEREECLFGANGMNDWDKGVGSALTYGERYFLLKFFHVPTDADDNDALTDKRGESYVPKQKPITWLTEEQFNATLSADIKGIEAVLKKYSGDGFCIKKEWKNALEIKLKMLKDGK